MLKQPSFTFGIEEEYHLVDIATRDLAPAPPQMMEACTARLGSRVSPEMLKSQIEIGTGVCRDFRSARAEVAELRREVAGLAREHGLAPIASGTHPFARWSDLETTQKERYQLIERDLAIIGRRLVISGMHVHVGIEDPELRIEIMNQVRYFLPHLMVLSTSSPFWQGHDTGLKSFRLAINVGSPRSGLPGRFSGWDEYQRTVDMLVGAGVIEDSSKIWWDIRPSSRFPTLEMRITDVMPRIDDAMTVAALYVCLCRMLYRLRSANLSWRTYPVFLLQENRWRAQRYGTEGTLIDLGRGSLVPIKDLIAEILDLVREDAQALGCLAEVEGARRILESGTSSDRQVATFNAALKQGATSEEAFRQVVDQLIEETVADL